MTMKVVNLAEDLDQILKSFSSILWTKIWLSLWQ